jgi:type IV pilus assembly protein PilW
MKTPIFPISRPMQRQKGFSLIELLVAMVMGLGMMAVVLLTYQNMTAGSRTGATQQQMNEDAQAVFQILGLQLRGAGYNPIRARSTIPQRDRLSPTPIPANEQGLGIFGCTNGFSNATGPTAASQISLLTCSTAASGTTSVASLAVQYVADAFSPNTAGPAAAPVPADCRGFTVPTLSQGLTLPTAPPGSAPTSTATYNLVENRYYISNGGLSCTGNGGATPFGDPPQPLVGNIESMAIDYGVISLSPVGSPTTAISGYLRADQIGAASGADATADPAFNVVLQIGSPPVATPFTGSLRWSLVTTARVCLVVRSETATLTDVLNPNSTPPVYGYYAGCNVTDNQQIAITDRFARKSYVMHFALRNRIGVPI